MDNTIFSDGTLLIYLNPGIENGIISHLDMVTQIDLGINFNMIADRDMAPRNWSRGAEASGFETQPIQ